MTIIDSQLKNLERERERERERESHTCVNLFKLLLRQIRERSDPREKANDPRQGKRTFPYIQGQSQCILVVHHHPRQAHRLQIHRRVQEAPPQHWQGGVDRAPKCQPLRHRSHSQVCDIERETLLLLSFSIRVLEKFQTFFQRQRQGESF